MWILEDITVPKCGVFKPALVFHGLVLSGILPSPSLWTCHRIQREPLCETQARRFKMWLPVTSTEALVHFFLLNFSPFMGTNKNFEFPYHLSQKFVMEFVRTPSESRPGWTFYPLAHSDKFWLSSKNLPFATDGYCYRDSQLVKIERISDCKVLRPNWYIYNPPPVFKAQGKL